MTATPTISWYAVRVPPTAAVDTFWGWQASSPTDTPPPVTLVHGTQKLQVVVSVTGSVSGDPGPKGTLVASVTPGTGITLADYNFDASNPPNELTNTSATAITNYSGQAEGMFYVAFASAGTFSVSVAYTSTDGNYSSATVPTPISVTAT